MLERVHHLQPGVPALLHVQLAGLQVLDSLLCQHVGRYSVGGRLLQILQCLVEMARPVGLCVFSMLDLGFCKFDLAL